MELFLRRHIPGHIVDEQDVDWWTKVLTKALTMVTDAIPDEDPILICQEYIKAMKESKDFGTIYFKVTSETKSASADKEVVTLAICQEEIRMLNSKLEDTVIPIRFNRVVACNHQENNLDITVVFHEMQKTFQFQTCRAQEFISCFNIYATTFLVR